MQRDQDWSWAGGLAEGLKQAWGEGGGFGRDLHAQGGFEEGLCNGGRALVAPRVFVIYCQPPRDLTPFLLLLSSFFFLSSSLLLLFFFVMF